MDIRNQNTTAQPAGPAPVAHHVPAHAGRRGPAKLTGLLVALIVLAALVLGAYFVYQAKAPSVPDSSKYQALFMTNGQVYFGKLGVVGGKYTELTKVYYLQVQQPVQPATGAKTTTDSSSVSLTKLGNELHGPTDKMHIASDQVLFWEDLKDDSTVVKAIKSYENK